MSQHSDACLSSRLLIAYERAKEYNDKIASGIEHQLETWQRRRQIILDASQQTTPQPSYDFLASKTERINELTLQSVEGSTLSTTAVRRRFVSSLLVSSALPCQALARPNDSYGTGFKSSRKINGNPTETITHKRCVEW